MTYQLMGNFFEGLLQTIFATFHSLVSTTVQTEGLVYFMGLVQTNPEII